MNKLKLINVFIIFLFVILFIMIVKLVILHNYYDITPFDFQVNLYSLNFI